MNKTATKKGLGFRIKQTITDAVYDVLSDPDFGLTLRPEVASELAERSQERGKKVSLATLKRRYL